jgi:hypothetical protein
MTIPFGLYYENAATSCYFPESSLVKGVSGDVQDKGSIKAFIAYLHVIVQQSSGLVCASLRGCRIKGG